jgi:ribosomal protein S18 acetylase RimI-like enzyme
MEVHETRVNARGPGRDMIDLGDAVALFDRDDPDPFFNRVGAIRWPSERSALDVRIDAALSLFEARGRQPYLWLPPGLVSTSEIAEQLRSRGFVEVGGGALVMLQVRDPRAIPARPLPPGAILERLVAGPSDVDATEARIAAEIVAEAFGISADRVHSLAVEIADDMADPGADVRLVRVDGIPAAVGRRHGADRMSYLSAIGVRTGYQGRGLGEAITRALVDEALGLGHDLIFLGVYVENQRARQMYQRVGFETLGGPAPEYILP